MTRFPAFMVASIAAAMLAGGCASPPEPVANPTLKQRVAQDRARDEIGREIMGAEAPRVRRTPDIQSVIDALRTDPSPMRNTRLPGAAPGEHLPRVRLSTGNGIALRHAVGLVCDAIGYDYYLFDGVDANRPVMVDDKPVRVDRVLDEIAFQSGQYIALFPESHLVLVWNPDGVTPAIERDVSKVYGSDEPSEQEQPPEPAAADTSMRDPGRSKVNGDTKDLADGLDRVPADGPEPQSEYESTPEPLYPDPELEPK